MEHMSPLDASFLDMEDQDTHVSLAIASLAVAEGPPPSQAEFIEGIRGRLPLVRRYRQKVRRVPFDLAGPVWVDEPDIDLEYHIRRIAVPAPGDGPAVCRLFADIMTHRLDRDRPLWEYWVVEGLPEGRWAVLSKVHHCMVDGVSGNELYRLLLDATPEKRKPVPDTWHPVAQPDAAILFGDAVGQLIITAANQMRLFATALRRPERAAKYVTETAQGIAELAASMTPLRPTSLLGPIGTSRRYAVARVQLADLIRIAKGFQVTVNDVVLTAVTGAFRAVLLERGESAAPDAVRTLVPVNMRADHEKSIIDDRVSMMLPMLPVDVAEPVERLRVVHERIGKLKKGHEIQAGASLTTWAPYEPFPVMDAGVRAGLRLPQRALNTVVTNVPGPPAPLYILGRPIREILPWVPIANRMRIGVSVFTFNGQATFGVTTDFASVPEADLFAAVIADEVAALAAALPPRPAATAPAATAPADTAIGKPIGKIVAKAVRPVAKPVRPVAKPAAKPAAKPVDGAPVEAAGPRTTAVKRVRRTGTRQASRV
jgi:diacylglycerol O-acyltransferase